MNYATTMLSCPKCLSGASGVLAVWCMVGSIAAAMKELGMVEDVEYAYTEFINKWMEDNKGTLGDDQPGFCVAGFNDHFETTAADVVASLQRMDFTEETDDARESVS